APRGRGRRRRGPATRAPTGTLPGRRRTAPATGARARRRSGGGTSSTRGPSYGTGRSGSEPGRRRPADRLRVQPPADRPLHDLVEHGGLLGLGRDRDPERLGERAELRHGEALVLQPPPGPCPVADLGQLRAYLLGRDRWGGGGGGGPPPALGHHLQLGGAAGEVGELVRG